MALAVAQSVHATGVSAPPMTATFPGSTTVGNLIVVFVQSYNGTPGTGSVTDNKSNTYTRNYSTASGLLTISVYSAPITTGGASHVITLGSGVDIANLDVVEVSGAAASSYFDKSVSNAATSTGPYTSGSTGTLSQADEIVIVGVGVDTGEFQQITEDASYTLIGEFLNGTAGFVSNAAYKIVSATTAINHSWTSTYGSNPWFAGAVTYKAAASVPNLVVANGAHAHTADNVVLTIPGVFTVNDAAHAHTADQVPFPPQAIPANALHAHTADAVPFSSDLYTDNFNRADTTPGTGGLGANWTSNGGFQISSNTAIATASADYWVNWSTAMPSPDHYIECDIINPSAGGYLVLHVRTSGPSATLSGYEAFMGPGTTTFEIGRDSGGYTQLALGGSQPGTSCRLRLEAVGSAIRVYRNGVLALTATDPSPLTGTYVGLNAFFYAGGGGAFDNFAAGVVGTNLNVDSASHAHTADNVVLSTGFVVNSAAHAHTAQNVLLPATLVVNDAAHTHTATQLVLARFLYPVAVSGRKLVDQTGGIFILNDVSSWGMPNNLTNAEITQALTGVAARHFSTVHIGCFIDAQGPPTWHKYTNATGQAFFTGAPFKTPMGPAWGSVDWIVSEATRLNLCVMISIFGGYNTANGITGELLACTVAECQSFGQSLGSRYVNNPNVFWSLEWEAMWSPTSAEGARADAIFHGIRIAYDAAGRTEPLLIFAEPFAGSGAGAFIGTGWTWMLVSASSLYSYSANSAEAIDTAYNTAGTTTYPVWDSEPAYIGSTAYNPSAGSYAPLTDQISRQNWRERNYSVLIRGGVGINWGDEAWWPFGAAGLFNLPWTWQDVMTNVTAVEAQYCWDLLCTAPICQDPAWAPNNSFLVTGTGSGDTKAAVGMGATTAVVYFPNVRTAAVNTTLIGGANPVRLRWYDPTTGTFTVIAVGEARNANRSVTFPGGVHSDNNNDWVLVVDDRLDLGVDSASHAHTANNVALVVPFTVQNGTHTHTADNIVLSTGLVVDSAAHAHIATNVAVGGGLSLANAAHAHTADNVILGVSITVADALHGHKADNIDVAPAGVVANAFHAHTAQNVVLTVVAISKIRLGATTPQAMKVGTAAVSRVYLGPNQVF